MCHRHEIWVKEKTKRFGCISSNWGFWHWCWQIYRWNMAFPVCMCSGFPTLRSKQMIVTSWNDITVISHAILGGNYKRRAHTNLGAVIWVFWYWMVGSIDKSQTLYSSYLGASHGAEHNQNELCVLFIHMHVPRYFGEPFSQYDFSCLMLARYVTTCIPLNLVLSEAQITTLWQQIARAGQIASLGWEPTNSSSVPVQPSVTFLVSLDGNNPSALSQHRGGESQIWFSSGNYDGVMTSP